MSEEVRVTDPKTGGQKGRKLAQLGAVDPQALMLVAEVAGFGSIKYARLNYARGYVWSLSYDALQRHLHAFWNGENTDAESGLPHLAHAAWHALALLTFSERGRGTDDRLSTLLELWRTASDAAVSGMPEVPARPSCSVPNMRRAKAPGVKRVRQVPKKTARP